MTAPSWPWPPGPPGSGRVPSPPPVPPRTSTVIDPPGGRPAPARPPALPSPPPPAGPWNRPPPIPSTSRAGALAAAGLILPGGLTHLVDTGSAPAVLELAVSLGLRQLWIGPSLFHSLKFPPAFEVPLDAPAPYSYGVPHPWLEAALAAGWEASTSPAGLSPWFGMRRGDAWVDLVLPSWDDGNPFRRAPFARVLLEALELYAVGVGIRYRRSPTATGLALMYHVHDKKGGMRIPAAHLPPPALETNDGAGVGAWLDPGRTVGADEWVHGWDLNGMYLAACSDAWLGYGEPALVPGPANIFDARPGYYRASITARAGSSFPLPFTADGKPHWYTPPTLRLAADMGASIKPREAWVYPERARWLEPWYSTLRDARKALLELEAKAGGGPTAPALALEAVKATYTRSLGRLAGRWLQEGDPTFRPDWRDVVIARARANMWRHLLRVQALSSQVPLGFNADAVLYVSPHEDPTRAALALGLETGRQLGKWKHSGRLAGPTAAHILGTAKTPLRRLRALLDALGPA